MSFLLKLISKILGDHEAADPAIENADAKAAELMVQDIGAVAR